jgi:hypothetical protein
MSVVIVEQRAIIIPEEILSEIQKKLQEIAHNTISNVSLSVSTHTYSTDKIRHEICTLHSRRMLNTCHRKIYYTIRKKRSKTGAPLSAT